MKKGYVPDRGDAIRITFNPQTGHEQSGRRPAIVLSPSAYSGKINDYPFEVVLPDNSPIVGAALSDQVKSLDWQARNTELICALPSDIAISVTFLVRQLGNLTQRVYLCNILA